MASQHHQRHLTEPGLFSSSTLSKLEAGRGLWWGIPDAFSAGLQVALQGPPPAGLPSENNDVDLTPGALGGKMTLLCSFVRTGCGAAPWLIVHGSLTYIVIPFSLKGV